MIKSFLFFVLSLVAFDVFAAVAPLEEDKLSIRDPFKRPVAVVEKTEILSPLQLIPVEQFKMVGVITGPDRTKAMIAGPDGKTFFVSEKAKIGTRKGIITKITAETIFVRERVVNFLGQEEILDTEIHLPSESKVKLQE